MPLTGQFVSRTASFSRDFRAIHTRSVCLTYTQPRPGLTFFLARDEIAIDAGDNAMPRLARQPPSPPGLFATTTIFLLLDVRALCFLARASYNTLPFESCRTFT